MKKMDARHKVLIKAYLLSRHSKATCERDTSYRIFEIVVLLLLSEKPRTIRQLSDLLHVNHSCMSERLSRLEKREFIGKKVARDHRYRVITVTDKGWDFLEKILKGMTIYTDEVFSTLSQDEINLLSKLLTKLNYFSGDE